MVEIVHRRSVDACLLPEGGCCGNNGNCAVTVFVMTLFRETRFFISDFDR